MNIIDHCIELLRINGEELCITKEQWEELVSASGSTLRLTWQFDPHSIEGNGATFLGKPIRIVESKVHP